MKIANHKSIQCGVGHLQNIEASKYLHVNNNLRLYKYDSDVNAILQLLDRHPTQLCVVAIIQ